MIDKDFNLKLLDFGISKISKRTVTETSAAGTLLYMAPENFNIDNNENDLDEYSKTLISTKVDVWAFGCMMSESFSGYKPW